MIEFKFFLRFQSCLFLCKIKLSKENVREMEKNLLIAQESTKKKFNPRPQFYYPPPKIPFFKAFDSVVHVPFYWGLSYFGNELRPKKEDFIETKLQFFGTLRPEQEEFQQRAVKQLNEQGSCLLAVYPGWGKTITSLSIIPALQTTTLIIVNKIVLIEQWQSAIKKTLHLEPFVIKGAKCKIKPSLIYIGTQSICQNMTKMFWMH